MRISKTKLTKENQRKQQNQLITYYTENRSRMDYRQYKIGAGIIGSGAIEAANQGGCSKNETLWTTLV